jgi:hypothetical protein
MRLSRSRFMAIAALTASLACGGDSTGVDDTPTVDLSGDWIFEEWLDDPALDLSCRDVAAVKATQTGSTYSASGHQAGECTVGNTAPQSFFDAVAMTGTVSGKALRFQIPPCPYSGSANANPADRISGSISCDFTEQGVRFSLRGQWRMRRAGLPPGSGAVDTDPPTLNGVVIGSLVVGVGDMIQLQVSADDAFGVMWVGYRFSGANGPADSVAVAAVNGFHQFNIPVTLAMTGSRSLTAFARDLAGLEGTAPAGTLNIGIPPTVSAAAAAPVLFLDEPHHILVHVTDDQQVARIGYRFLTLVGAFTSDSIWVSGTDVTDTLTPQVGPPGTFPVEIFARDQLGLSALDTIQLAIANTGGMPLGSVSDTIYGVGENLALRVVAPTGDGALAWIGYRLGGVAG